MKNMYRSIYIQFTKKGQAFKTYLRQDDFYINLELYSYLEWNDILVAC